MGDLVPSRLVPLTIDPPTEMAELHGSDALAPNKPYSFEQPPLPVVARDMRRVIKGTDPASYTFPIDAVVGARVVITVTDETMSIPSAHIVDAASGRQLDRARDVSANNVNSLHQPVVAEASTGPALDGHGFAAADVTGPVPLTPGFEVTAPRMRVLTFDALPAPTAGLVRLVVPAELQASGVWMEVQQPNTHITLSAVTDALNHSFGETAVITATLLDDSTPIDGATVEGNIELPGHADGGTLTFSSVGGGKYVAQVTLGSTDWAHVGVWNMRLHATGAFSGAPFERNVETAFGYYPAHARINALGQPVITRGADGLIDDVSVDADVETLATDRFSLGGTLTYTAADGTEHPLASAQSGKVISKGVGTITLHFDNASIALARMDGPFHVRDVALVSQAAGITQHRIGRALDLVTPPIRAKEIRFPQQISLQAQDLIDNGDLPRIN
jgi:hypothetical protein